VSWSLNVLKVNKIERFEKPTSKLYVCILHCFRDITTSLAYITNRNFKQSFQWVTTIITRWLYGMEWHNTVVDSKLSAICAQAVYFLHSTMLSVTWLPLSDVRVICRVTYFQFPIQSAFLPYQSPGSTAAYWFKYAFSDVAENLGKHRSCTERTDQGNDFELILKAKMETRPRKGVIFCWISSDL